MCGVITHYGWNGEIVEKTSFISREDFVREVIDCLNCGEPISYKIKSTDKNFKKNFLKIIRNQY